MHIKFWSEKLKGKRQLGRPRTRWKIKINRSRRNKPGVCELDYSGSECRQMATLKVVISLGFN
jgi:hypothetical protein